MSMRALGLLALMGLGVAAQPAHAFNVTNNTNWPVCVYSGSEYCGGSYCDIVQPTGTPNEGWYLDDPIYLTFAVLIIYESGDEACDTNLTTSCTVPPHYAVQINEIHFSPGDPQTLAGQTAAYRVPDPATFTVDCGS